MRALNITIRCAVHEALREVDKARNVAAQPHRRGLYPAEREALGLLRIPAWDDP